MTNYFNIGELVNYKRFSHSENLYCIILRQEVIDPGKTKYFKCLAENKIQIICEVWLEKT